jgi:AcrR family transcriptional regulator
MFDVTERVPPHPRGHLRQRRRTGREGPHGRRERHLSRETVVAAALRVVDAEGVDAVTMRRVGEELGTGAASLYAHVNDKDELLAAAFDHVIGEEDFGVVPDPQHWEDQIKELMRKVRAVLLRHNDIAKVSLGSVPTGANAARAMESFMAVLHAAGMPPRVIGFACDLTAQFVNASVYEESLFRVRLRSPAEWSAFHRELLDYFDSLPASEFPTMKALAPYMADPDEPDDARFEFGLDTLVRGLAAHVPAVKKRRSS